MRRIIFLLVVLASTGAFAQEKLEKIFSSVYGAVTNVCTQDADADTGGANLLGPFLADRRYVVYCHDGAGSGIACECIQGTASANANTSVGITMFAGEKMIVIFRAGKLYISCLPFVDNQKYDVCPLD